MGKYLNNKKKISVLTAVDYIFLTFWPPRGGVKGQKHNFQRVYRKIYYFSPLAKNCDYKFNKTEFEIVCNFGKFEIWSMEILNRISQKST